jgi:glycosyltransferase involved in cell wall biosynthesis
MAGEGLPRRRAQKGAPAAATIGLVMIVKNEERTLPRLASAVRSQIDHWTIVDTGSRDGTVKIAQEAFAGVPGEVIEDVWRGYGPSRNVALSSGEPWTDWLLTLDADEVVKGDIRAALPLDSSGVDCMEAELHYDSLRLWSPRLFRSRSGWRWNGRAHEYLDAGPQRAEARQTRHFHVVHHADGGNRPGKLERELALLELDDADNPDDPRTVFYVARTYDDMGRAEEAAEWYRRRTMMGGWDEERWYALWRLGACLLAIGRVDEGCGVLWRSWAERPWRAEPLHVLATHSRLNQWWALCWDVCQMARLRCGARPGRPATRTSDRLFVHTDVYVWGVAYEQSIAAFYVGEHDQGRMLCDYLLGLPTLPAAIRSSVEENRRYYWPRDVPTVADNEDLA